MVRTASRSTQLARWRVPALIATLACFAATLVAVPASAATPRSIFVSTDVPKIAAVSSTRSANIGVKFTASASGVVTALKFYRSSKQTKAYTGSLWSSKSKRLAKVTFAKSTKVGWQTARLSKPISIKKGSYYYASYLATGGRYPTTKSAFVKKRSHDGLTVPAKGGRYAYGKSSTRPKKTTNTNYFVDVVFVPTSSPISAAQLKTAATKRVFFGHQSVGWNVVNGVADLYSAAKIAGPPQAWVESPSSAISPTTGGVLAHTEVGVNGSPDGKVDDFAAYLRGGVGAKVQVAVVKYCYVDIYQGADVTARFNHYRSAMASLEAEFPEVTFLYATNPLETGASSSNAARTQFNALVRAEYASTGRLWDIALIESTRPDGSRLAGTVDGKRYEALYSGYTSDGGHLNATGGKLVAAELLRLVAQAS